MDNKIDIGNDISKELTRYSWMTVFAVAGLTIVFLGISVAFGTFIAKGITKPIEACSNRIYRLSKGDLDSPVPIVKIKDEVSILAKATNDIVINFKGIAEDVYRSLDIMGSGDFSVKSANPQLYVGRFAPIVDGMEKIKTKLQSMIVQIGESSRQVSISSQQVSSGAQSLSQGTTE